MFKPFSRLPSRSRLLKWGGVGALVVILGMGLSLAVPGCSVGYLIRSGYFQAELMSSRIPVEEARANRSLDEGQLRALDDFEDVKQFGAEIGLSATENYETIALDWPRKIYNIMACDPAAFEPKRWWFPIVGSVPYLGYFREEEVKAARERLEEQGLDVYVRGVGAYSTLGWFEDPILPWMLDWSTHQIAQTTLHELVHATLWIPGSVKFNESFANFVGKEAAIRYLQERHGLDHAVTIKAQNSREDSRRLRLLLHDVYMELDEIYSNPQLNRAEKMERKGQTLKSIESRVLATDFNNPERIIRSIRKGEWNNARMIQFKAYNHNQEHFQKLLDAQDGDLVAFIETVGSLTEDAEDPFDAIESATE